jgi:hypothetical protein
MNLCHRLDLRVESLLAFPHLPERREAGMLFTWRWVNSCSVRSFLFFDDVFPGINFGPFGGFTNGRVI